MSMVWSPRAGRLARTALTTLTIWVVVWSAGVAGAIPIARAQTDAVDPLTLLLTHDDAGADATMVGDPFELKDSSEIGDESRGLSACNGSCNSSKEIYLHKRLVARVENVVSVVYVWGLDNEEGVTDASARYFASLVAHRAHG